MKGKVFGCILMVIGTSIGGGMLVLPSALTLSGVYNSISMLVIIWLIMLSGALYIAEVNNWLHRDNNIISMAKHTLGKPGQAIAWITYLGLLYSLTSAYISGGAGVTQSLFQVMHAHLPNYLGVLIFTVVLAAIVWFGVASVDKANRFLMLLKFLVLIGVIVLIAPHTHKALLHSGSIKSLLPTLTVVITSFSFAGSVPTFCSYLDYDMRSIRIAIIGGSFFTLLCYIVWVLVVQGAVDTTTLSAMMHQNTPKVLTYTLAKIASSGLISSFVHAFTIICMITAFISVTLGLSDFLADGMGVKKQDNKLLVYAVTFIPPVLISLFYPAIFATALGYAGIFCLILLLLLPALMSWFGRYRRSELDSTVSVGGGKGLLLLIMLIAVVLIAISIYQKFVL